MPVYKQYLYTKERDCLHCRFYKNQLCRHPVPNEFNCSFKIIKTWTHKYYFKTSIRGRTFLRRGFLSKETAREAETLFRKELLGETFNIARNLPSYLTMLNIYAERFKNLKYNYYHQVKTRIKNYYSNLFPDISITKLVKTDADRCRKLIDQENIQVKTKNDKLNFIKNFFSWIQENYNYRFNPIFQLDKFRDYEIKRIVEKEEIVSFSQFLEIYKQCDSDYYQLALLTLFLFGYRLGELLALKVDSINFETNKIEIYQAVNFKNGKGKKNYTLTTPKTAKSKRIQLMPIIYSNKLKSFILDHNLKENHYIFYRSENDKENMIHENTFRRKADEYCKKYNPSFHPHMLRTSICTHLREQGVPISEVSKYLGHEDIKVTEEYYSKVTKEKKEMINEVIDEILQKIT